MSAQLKSHTDPHDAPLMYVLDTAGLPVEQFLYPDNILDPEAFYGSITSGVSPNPADRLRALCDHPSIGIRFSRFTEGRPYSMASRLRELGYQGELHATGEVHEELMHHMIRVGFTHFHFDSNPGQIDASVLKPFSFAYQQTV
jgi:uncharacterized protein (DUF934 family)